MVSVDLPISRLKDDFERLYDALNEYCAKKYKNLFSIRDRLSEDKQSQELEFCERTSKIIKRISKDIGMLEKALNKNLKIADIDEANNNLVDITVAHYYLQKRFQKLKSENKTLKSLYKVLESVMESLNVNVQQYNEFTENKLYTVQEAFDVFERNFPKSV